MLVGFKGDSSRLKNLYKELGLKEVEVNTFEEIIDALNANDGNTVITNYNEVVVFENPTADLVEKRNNVLSSVRKCKKNVYLDLTKPDPSLDRLPLDYHICTKVDTSDMKVIEDVFNFCNTDLPYSGKLSDSEYAYRGHSDERAEAKSLDDIKAIIR